MAREIQQIMQELETAYAPQRQAVQERMDQLPGFYAAQRAGAETARSNAFQDITRQANARGVVYSGAPIQEQQRYVGERYLPALAQLSGQEGEQRFGLQQALNQLGERQLTYAQQIRQKEMELDEERRRFDLQMQAQKEAEARAARAAAAANAGLGSLFNNRNNNTPAAPDPAAAIRGMANNPNPYVWHDFLRDANKTFFGGKANYGQLAKWVESNLGAKINSGTAADLALRNIFLNTPLDPRNARPQQFSAPRGGNFNVNQQISRVVGR